MSVSQIENKIKEAWENTPAVVEVKEIKKRSELPKWEECLKDHLHVGIIRRLKGDKVIVVKHKLEGVFELDCSIEKLNDKTLIQLGIFPNYENMICTQCGDFSTRIDVDRICVDCSNKNKENKRSGIRY